MNTPAIIKQIHRNRVKMTEILDLGNNIIELKLEALTTLSEKNKQLIEMLITKE